MDMPLMDALRSGVDLVNASNQGVSNAAAARYAYPMAQGNLYKLQTENKYLDPSLQAALHNQELINQYYGRSKEAEIGLQGAQADAARFKAKYPLLGEPGMAGQIGAALYMQANGINNIGGAPTTIAPPTIPTTPPTIFPPNQPAPAGGMAAPLQPPMTANAPVSPPMAPGQPQAPMAPPMQSPAPQPVAGQAGGLGQPLTLPQLMMQGINTTQEQKQAYAKFYEKRTQAYNYMSLPIDNKAALLAQAAGMGYDPTQATNLFMAGNTIDDLAKAKGFDLGNLPEPIYPTTKTSLTQIQKRQQALSEINNLNPVLASAIAPYAQRITGWSPVQVAQALKGTDNESQAKLLAARALMPEMSALRLRAMTGQVGIEAIREVTNASMGHIKVFQSLVTPEVYQKTNEYLDKWINDAVNAANTKGLSTYGGAAPTPATTAPTAIKKLTTEELLKMLPEAK
jgi:hypothetical protein